MPLDADKIEELSETLESALAPALAAAGLSHPASAAVLFGLRTIFRFVRLGSEIRESLEEARQNLDATVKASGLFRAPLWVSVDYTKLLNFFTGGEGRIHFPDACEQLDEEIAILQEPDHPRWQEAFEVLNLAYWKLPEIEKHGKLKDPLLDDLFGKWMDPGCPDYRAMFREMRLLCGGECFSLHRLKRQLSEYVRMRLEMLGADLQTITEARLKQVNDRLDEWIWEAVMGPGGAAKEAAEFIIKRHLEYMDREIHEVQNRKAGLSVKSVDPPTGSEPDSVFRLEKRLRELMSMKQRIRSAAPNTGNKRNRPVKPDSKSRKNR
ncbi:MAG TPA: hypothetical protein ENN03_07110 [bacterium]|nr:hypothetical protein [bacterium]